MSVPESSVMPKDDAKSRQRERRVLTGKALIDSVTHRYYAPDNKVKAVGATKHERVRQEFKKANKFLKEQAKLRGIEELLKFENEGGIEKSHIHERTLDVKQDEIIEDADMGTAAKSISLQMERGPYFVDFTADGQYMLTAGTRGEASLIEMKTSRCVANIFPNETIRAAKMCYNEQCWALAQKKYVCLYDKQGRQTQCFKSENGVYGLDYLPYHFLLTSVGESGYLRYRDLTHGEFAAVHKIKKHGITRVIRHNPYNGVVNLGHSDGTITLWTPSMNKPVVDFFGHKAGVTALTPFNTHYIASAGLDGYCRIFDLRHLGTDVTRIRLPSDGPVGLDVSPTGLLALSRGPQIHIWKDMDSIRTDPDKHFLKHTYKNGTRTNWLKFQPFEDVLVVGHTEGLQTMLVPGSGLAQPDVAGDNPYATSKERSNALVRKLIEKLPADSIVMDPSKFAKK